MKRRSREQIRQARKAARRSAMSNPGQNSNYARKVAYLAAHNIHGSDVPAPKPWTA